MDEYDNYNKYINVKVLLPRDNGDSESGKVIGRSVDERGAKLGEKKFHPLLNTQLYNVEFPDGSVEKLTENWIAITLYSSVDEYSHQYSEVKRITGHRKGADAISKADAFICDAQGKHHRYKTTKVWELQIL